MCNSRSAKSEVLCPVYLSFFNTQMSTRRGIFISWCTEGGKTQGNSRTKAGNLFPKWSTPWPLGEHPRDYLHPHTPVSSNHLIKMPCKCCECVRAGKHTRKLDNQDQLNIQNHILFSTASTYWDNGIVDRKGKIQICVLWSEEILFGEVWLFGIYLLFWLSLS